MIPLRNRPHLFEINTWEWLEELSRSAGRRVTLADVPESEWDSQAQLGFDLIWLMGVWERSPESRRKFFAETASLPEFQQAFPRTTMNDVAGSPYSIHDYSPDPRIGDWNALDIVREKLHARGMRLLLDFVPNHLAVDHAWTREHPEYFVQGSPEDWQRDPASFFRVETPTGARVLALGKDPYFPPWSDVAQLNHFNPELRAALIGKLREVCNHCDGVRCDMAMLVLNDIFAQTWAGRLGGAAAPAQEFWQEARAALPEPILLAEAYWNTEQQLIDLGFNFIYDKGFYDALRAGHAQEIRTRLAADLNYQSHMARFLENHDEDRAAVAFGPDRLRAAATIVATGPSLRFYHEGQLEGRRIHFPIQLAHIADEPVDNAIDAFYRSILQVTRDDIFHSGAWRLLSAESVGDSSNAGLIVYDWQNEKGWKLIVVNLSDSAAQGRIRLGERIASGRPYMLADILNGRRYVRGAGELLDPGLYVRLEPFEADIFDITPA